MILRQLNKTFLDQLIILDSVLCLGNCVSLVASISQNRVETKIFCFFIPFYSFFINVCNRLITIAVVIYRYIHVIKSTWVETKKGRNVLTFFICLMIAGSSLSLTIFSVYYRENSLRYLGKINFIIIDSFKVIKWM